MPTRAELEAVAEKAAAAFGIPADLFKKQIDVESGFNPNPASNPQWPQSAGGPAGIAQFIPGTAAQYKVDRFDPVSSLWGAAAYDADLYKQTGSWAKVLKTYGTTSSTGALNPAQQSVADLATSLDANGTTAGAATSGLTPVTFPIPGVGSMLSGVGDFITNIFVRAALILIGVIVIWQGLAMMRGSSVVENVTIVKNKYSGSKPRESEAA